MEWFALLIPVITAVVLLKKFSRQVLWWEFIVLLVTPIVLISISKTLVELSQTNDTEYWGGFVTKTEYYEDWNEKVSCSHAKYRTKTDSKGNTKEVFDGWKHPYDVDYHPPYWLVIDSNGSSISVDSTRFDALCNQFGNKTFVGLHRDYHTDDGDKYEAIWKLEKEKLESTTTVHTYENRVQASDSVFNFQEVDPKTYGLHEYPTIRDYYRQTCILGPGGVTMPNGEKELQYWNATLGARKQVRIFFLVFKNKPMQAAVEQRNYWKGGNKNELIVCMGVNDTYEPQWCFPFSWSEAEICKIEARNAVMDQKELDLPKLAEVIAGIAEEKFVRKKFEDFGYISVTPPTWAVVLIYALTFGASIGLAAWAVKNEFGAVADTNRFVRSYPKYPW